MKSNRRCRCDHGFPLCCCALGLTGDDLLDASRDASSIAGWPSGNLDADAVREHNARMKAAREARKSHRKSKSKRSKG